MKTIDEEFEEWVNANPATCIEVSRTAAKFIFFDGYEAGHAAAGKTALSSIAKAFTPPKGFLE